MRGQTSFANWIVYAILLILVMAVAPGLIANNNAAVGQININDPAFIVTSLVPVIFIGFVMFKGLPVNQGG